MASWAVELGSVQLAAIGETHELSVNAWFVEASAEFSEGSNGEEIYPSIVSKIIKLGTATTGTATISIPETYDGNDMQVHLMYHLIPIETDEDNGVDDVEEKDDSSALPSISIIASLACIVVAAALVKKK